MIKRNLCCKLLMIMALCPDEHGVVFSGSAVIDYENISGLGKPGNHGNTCGLCTAHPAQVSRVLFLGMLSLLLYKRTDRVSHYHFRRQLYLGFDCTFV